MSRGRKVGVTYTGTLYPESEWFERNPERALQIEDEAYLAAYFEGVLMVRGAHEARQLRTAYDKATRGVTA